MISNIEQLIVTKDLIWEWTNRTVRGRYQQSLMGWFWAVIQPAASVAVFAVVFTLIVPVDTGGIPYILFSYTAMVPWTFFASWLNDMANSLVQNMSLVTKIYFPREAIPIAVMLARLLDFGVAAGLVIILMIIYHIPVFPVGLLFVPIILLVQIALQLGFRDNFLVKCSLPGCRSAIEIDCSNMVLCHPDYLSNLYGSSTSAHTLFRQSNGRYYQILS